MWPHKHKLHNLTPQTPQLVLPSRPPSSSSSPLYSDTFSSLYHPLNPSRSLASSLSSSGWGHCAALRTWWCSNTHLVVLKLSHIRITLTLQPLIQIPHKTHQNDSFHLPLPSVSLSFSYSLFLSVPPLFLLFFNPSASFLFLFIFHSFSFSPSRFSLSILSIFVFHLILSLVL